MENIEERIKKVIKNRINPILAEHSGYCELSGFNNGVAAVKLGGECSACMMAQLTVDNVVKKELMDAFPSEIKDVMLDSGIGADTVDMLKRILGRDINI